MPACVRFHASTEHGSVGCTVGLASDLYVGAYGEDAAEALHKASALASQLTGYIEKHPELAAALSVVPGSALALRALGSASKALKYGHKLEDVARKYGPRVAKVTKSLLSIF